MSRPHNITPPMVQALKDAELFYNELYTRPTPAPITLEELRLVWFSETPNGWTAMITTTRQDHLHFEVFFSAVEQTTSINCYKKMDSVKLPVMGLGC